MQPLHTHLENLHGKQALSGPLELNLHHSPLSLSHRQGLQAWQPEHIPLSSWGHSGSPIPGTGHSPGEGDELRTGENLGRWMGPAGRADCEELKTDPAVPSLEQGLRAWSRG